LLNSIPDDTADRLAAAIKNAGDDRLLIIDLDETLWLRNSTECFLADAAPSWLAAWILAMLDGLRPWRIARLWGDKAADAAFYYRDWMRVAAIAVVMPWSLWRWRGRAREIGPTFANKRLLDALAASGAGGRLVVATHGFAPIAAPLVAAILPDAELLCAPLAKGWLLRRSGKAAAVAARYDAPSLRSALLVTDHAEHDRDIIDAVEDAFVIRWPDARFERAHAMTYLPFRYTRLGKHAGRNHLLRVFLGIDGVALLMTVLPAATAPLAAAAACLLLTVSFFIIFEIGYHENDQIGAQREADPHLTPARLDHLGVMDPRQAWLWAVAAGLVGVVIVAAFDLSDWPHGDATTVRTGLLFGLWCALLLVSRGLFALFNRLDKPSRRHLYLPLQLCKGLAVVGVLQLPSTVAGSMLLLAIAFSRWLSYVVYRGSGRRGETPDRLFRLYLLLALVLAGVIAGLPDLLAAWPTWVVLAWAIFTARQQLSDAWRSARFL